MTLAAPLASTGSDRASAGDRRARRDCRRHRLCRPGAGAHPGAPSGGDADRGDVVGGDERAARAAGAGAHLGRRRRAARRRTAGRRRRHRVPGAARGRVGRARAAAARARRPGDRSVRAPSAFATTPSVSAGTRRRRRCRPARSTASPSGTSRQIRAGAPRLQSRLLSDGGAARARAARGRRRCCAARSSIDAKSGISGAGKTPIERTHFSENHGSVAAYGIFSHRHTAEIEQELATTGDLRAASRAARPRHSRNDLRARCAPARPTHR